MTIQDWFPLGLTGLISLQCKGLSRVFNTSINSSALSLPYGAFTSVVHDYWKNQVSFCAGSQREELHPWQWSWGRRLGIRKGRIEPQEFPLEILKHLPPKPESAYFTALGSHLHLWLYGGLSWVWQECFSSQLWEAWDVLNCLNTDSFEQLKDWLEIVLVKGFSLVGPMFTAKFPYPLPAVSLAVYWLI